MTLAQPIAGDGAGRKARATMDRIGNQLLNDSKAALEKADSYGEKGERFRRRDLLSLLLKANMSTEVHENQRMNDQDVLAREFRFLSLLERSLLIKGIARCRSSDVPCCWTRNHQVSTKLPHRNVYTQRATFFIPVTQQPGHSMRSPSAPTSKASSEKNYTQFKLTTLAWMNSTPCHT
jgi:hypothetical protein